MSYSAQAQLSGDPDFISRVSASAAVEVAQPENPVTWARNHIWRIAAAPGFADKYASAFAGGVPRPGNDPAVISDGEILAAVQAEIERSAVSDYDIPPPFEPYPDPTVPAGGDTGQVLAKIDDDDYHTHWITPE